CAYYYRGSYWYFDVW
nr:immunoglobulin heavy chain junction region [Mus musculus]